jgi:hypothetical protein
MRSTERPGRSNGLTFAAAEQALELTFPKVMADFYLTQNGGLPERCYFLQENGISVWLDAMIPIERLGRRSRRA